MTRRTFAGAALASLGALAAAVAARPLVGRGQDMRSGSAGLAKMTVTEGTPPTRADKVVKTDAEWKALLDPKEYDILRNAGTEMARTGKYWDNHAKGTYTCAGCALDLFSSETKFESGTGWPSFTSPIGTDHVFARTDSTHGWSRTEVLCNRCGGHLGHVFDDGPAPTGLRFCINGNALDFVGQSPKPG
jgi:peptide-methionine (R)-S-oxide reductase